MEFPTHIQKIIETRTIIAGVDEVGRGCWAGPLVACAVVLPPQISFPTDIIIRDSKKLMPAQRKRSYHWIIQNALSINITLLSNTTIDAIGLAMANPYALVSAMIGLSVTPEYIFIDGGTIDEKFFTHARINIPHQSIIHGDQSIPAISAASIVAKVFRDETMRSYASQYPQYQFDKHKGYGTLLHRQCLDEHGICELHRQSYTPVKRYRAMDPLLRPATLRMTSRVVAEKDGIVRLAGS